MNNMNKYTIRSKWSYTKFFLWILLYIFPLMACNDDNGEVFPENWINISTEPLSFSFEGGTESRDAILGTGLDAAKVTSTLSQQGKDWITVNLENDKLKILCERSWNNKPRNTILTLTYDDNHKCNLPISQEAAPSSADQTIKIIGAIADSEETDKKDETTQNPLTLKMSYDGNKNTYFNSKFGAVNYPFHITYELETGHTLDYIVYTPRQTYNYWGAFDKFSVEISTVDKPDDFTSIGSYERGDGVFTPFTITLANGIKQVKKVRFVITKAYQNRVSCAEMEFFEASNNKFDGSSIFADKMGLQLKEGLTENNIKQLPNKYLKELGLALLKGEYDTSYRSASYRPYQKPDIMATKNKTNKYSLRDNPTGIYAKAGETLPIFVGEIYEGGKISMLIQDLNGGYSNSKTYELKEGYNEITVEIGGLIYILNHVEDDIPLLADQASEAQKQIIKAKTVQVHFGAGKVNGYFDIQKNTENDWKNILNKAQYQDIDILGKYSHITWKVEDFRAANTEITKTVANTDRLVELEWDFMGLFKYHKEFNNRMHLCIDYKATSPNASDYRTVYSVGNSNSYAEIFCNPARFGVRCWGPAHEVGHCNQTRPGLKWAGMTEVTNNIMSTYVRWELTGTSYLIEENNGNGFYKSAITLFKDNKTPHCVGYSDDIYNHCYEKLVPFWQLKLYVIDALGQKDFYRDLYEYYRGENSLATDAENMTHGIYQLDFVRQVCRMTRIDFTGYFKDMGFLTAVSTKLKDYGEKQFTITQAQIDALIAEIKAQNYPKKAPADLYLITDNNWESYKNK